MAREGNMAGRSARGICNPPQGPCHPGQGSARADARPGGSSRQFQHPLTRCDDGHRFVAEDIPEDQRSAATGKLHHFARLPPSHIVPAGRIHDAPFAAILEMDDAIPHETEMLARKSFSVHGNILEPLRQFVNS